MSGLFDHDFPHTPIEASKLNLVKAAATLSAVSNPRTTPLQMPPGRAWA